MTKIDDDLLGDPNRPSDAGWEMISDRVMGGVSDGSLSIEDIDGIRALRLRGTVSLENNGGFLQIARDLPADLDTATATGIALRVRGNGARYNLHLRTDAVTRPWQSYRASFTAPERWTDIQISFANLTAHRLDAPFDAATLRRIGLVAIGEAFEADLAISALRLLR